MIIYALMHLHIHFMHGKFNYETRPNFDSIKNTSYKSCPSNWLHLNKNNNILAVLCQMMKMIVTRTQLNPTHLLISLQTTKPWLKPQQLSHLL